MSRYQRKTDRVPLAPLQEAFRESGLSLNEVCHRLGWTRRNYGRVLGDTSRLQRALGLRLESNGHSHALHSSIGLRHALRIAEALGIESHIVESWLPEPEPEPAGNHDACPECGTTATWRDSWDQERCERCWAIVRTASEVAA